MEMARPLHFFMHFKHWGFAGLHSAGWVDASLGKMFYFEDGNNLSFCRVKS
jgi:hypothetical protein